MPQAHTKSGGNFVAFLPAYPKQVWILKPVAEEVGRLADGFASFSGLAARWALARAHHPWGLAGHRRFSAVRNSAHRAGAPLG